METFTVEEHGLTLSALVASPTATCPTCAQLASRIHSRYCRILADLPWAPPLPGTDAMPSSTAGAAAGERLSTPQVPCTPAPPAEHHADVARLARRAQRLAQYERARELRQQGYTWAVVAQQVGVSQRTLRSWLATEGFPERKRRTGDRSCLDPYRTYLQQRWEAGERNATQLWHEIRAQGFRGSYRRVASVLAPWRQRKIGRKRGPTTGAAAPTPPAPPALTVRQLAYSLLRRPDTRTEAERNQLIQLQQADPLLATLATHTEVFAQMVRERAAEWLEPWLEGVLASPWRELKRFAQGLRHDYAAVQATLTWPYSNGPTEGHVNRLKLFKRQMYGRAKLDLLRQRVLYAA
jgi:transposase